MPSKALKPGMVETEGDRIMQLIIRSIKMITMILFAGICVGACTPSQFLKVHYQLPAEPDTLEGISVNLTFTDMRRNKAILSKAAREDLTDFSETFTLVVGPADTDGKLLGVYDLASLLKEVFTLRLQHSGIKVVDKKESMAEIEIGLKDFRLDLKSRNWIFNMSYQLNLFKSGKLIASENTSGNAERLKTIGAREADKVISELVTDMINRLDVAAFFRQAGL